MIHGRSAIGTVPAALLAECDPVAVRIHRLDANAERVVLRLGLIEGYASPAEHLEIPPQVVRLEDERAGGTRPLLVQLSPGRPVRPQDDLDRTIGDADGEEASFRSRVVDALLQASPSV
jgi:hypothetical protein